MAADAELRRAAMLGAALLICLTIVGYNAVAAPDFHLPQRALTPYELPPDGGAGLEDTVFADHAVRRIRLNTATLEELQSLPGIGETLAQRILGYRVGNGRFKSRKELMQVEGIGEGVYEKLEDYLLL